MEDAIAAGRPAITDDALLLCRAEGIDAVLEVTGAVEFGAHVALEAIQHGKHIIAMNAELDSALGPILNLPRPRGRRDSGPTPMATSRA